MKASFSTLACGEWSFVQMVDAAGRYGYDGIELRVMNGSLDLLAQPEMRGASLRESAARLQDAKLAVPCIDTSACLHWPDTRKREEAIEDVLRHVEMAKALGAPLLRVFPDRIQPGATRAQTAQWIDAGLSELKERLRGSGVDVILEQHGDFVTAEQLAALSSEHAIIWDPVNALETAPSAAIPAGLQPRIRHVHMKDFVFAGHGRPQYVQPGQGIYPVCEMLRELDRIGYSGFVSFEWERHWHPALAAPEFALPQYIAWWRQERAA